MARVYTRSAPNSTREQLAKMMIDLGDDASRLRSSSWLMAWRTTTVRFYPERIANGNKPCVEQSDRSTAMPLIPSVFYAIEEVPRALGDGSVVRTGYPDSNPLTSAM